MDAWLWMIVVGVLPLGSLFVFVCWGIAELSCWWARGNGKRDDG